MAVDIQLRVRTQQLEQALEGIPGMTKRSVRQAVRGAEREWTKMPAAVKRATRKAERESREQMRLIRQNAANVFGDFVNDIDDAAEGIKALGPAGVAGAAAIAGFVAIGFAVFKLNQAVFRLVDGLGEAVQELEEYRTITEFAGLQTARQAQATRDYEAATRALGLATKAARVEIASEMIPTWSAAALVVLEITLRLGDMAGSMFRLRNAISEAVQEMNPFARALAGVASLGLTEAAVATDQWTESINGADDAAGGLLARSRALIGELNQLETTASTQEAQDRIFRALEAGRAQKLASRSSRGSVGGGGRPEPADTPSPFGPEISLATEIADMHQATQRTRGEGAAALEQQMAEQRIEAREREVEAVRQLQRAEEDLARARGQFTDSAIAAFGAVAGRLAQNERQATAASIATTLALQAVAVARAFAEAGPFAGFAAAAGAVAAIGAQLAKIPGASGAGGTIADVASVGASAARVGGAQSRARAARASAPSAGRSTQRGRGDSDQPAVVVAEYQNQVYDAQTETALRRSGSPLRDSRRSRAGRRR